MTILRRKTTGDIFLHLKHMSLKKIHVKAYKHEILEYQL
jgi:hypothetical protein